MVKHIVLFKYKPGVTPDQVRQVTDAFRELKDKIPGLLAFQQGANISREGRDLGFSHVYELTFEDETARDRYLPHPAHQQFGDFLGQVDVVEDVFVVDYIPGN
jgi:hypothetical protein